MNTKLFDLRIWAVLFLVVASSHCAIPHGASPENMEPLPKRSMPRVFSSDCWCDARRVDNSLEKECGMSHQDSTNELAELLDALGLCKFFG